MNLCVSSRKMSYWEELSVARAKETGNERAKREKNEKAYIKTQDLEFMAKYLTALEERIKYPSDGILAKKASTLNQARTKFGYNDAQLQVIEDANKLRMLLMEDSIIDNHDEMKASFIKLIQDGRNAFPMDGKFQRIARFFYNNKDKKGYSIVTGGVPMWFIMLMSEGGKRRTHKRSSRKLRTHKRKSHKRRTHKRRN